jgi:Holliday junction resolvase
MGNKEKGANAERELYGMFIENSFRAVRVAGSGMMENTSCDLLAGKAGNKKYCVECKASKSPNKYITKTQIEDFMIFSEIFGLEPVIAVKFNWQGWFFLSPRELVDSGKNWVVSLDLVKEKGKRFSQYFE